MRIAVSHILFFNMTWHVCNICRARFEFEQDLNQHKYVEHRRRPVRNESSFVQRKPKGDKFCNFCNQRFEFVQDLKRHTKLEHSQPPEEYELEIMNVPIQAENVPDGVNHSEGDHHQKDIEYQMRTHDTDFIDSLREEEIKLHTDTQKEYNYQDDDDDDTEDRNSAKSRLIEFKALAIPLAVKRQNWRWRDLQRDLNNELGATDKLYSSTKGKSRKYKYFKIKIVKVNANTFKNYQYPHVFIQDFGAQFHLF